MQQKNFSPDPVLPSEADAKSIAFALLGIDPDLKRRNSQYNDFQLENLSITSPINAEGRFVLIEFFLKEKSDKGEQEQTSQYRIVISWHDRASNTNPHVITVQQHIEGISGIGFVQVDPLYNLKTVMSLLIKARVW
ncbi:hypothetical protein [Spirosoma fluminis]